MAILGVEGLPMCPFHTEIHHKHRVIVLQQILGDLNRLKVTPVYLISLWKIHLVPVVHKYCLVGRKSGFLWQWNENFNLSIRNFIANI